jgi:putative membrane protein
MVKFTDADREKITAAIHAAERDTSGEFVAVVARSSDRYIASALLWAGGLALLLPGVLLFLPLHMRFVHIYQ